MAHGRHFEKKTVHHISAMARTTITVSHNSELLRSLILLSQLIVEISNFKNFTAILNTITYILGLPKNQQTYTNFSFSFQ